MRETTVKTGGMSCASCESAINRALMKLEGVGGASADYPSQTTRIAYDERKVGLDSIRKAIEGAGYDFGGEIDGKGSGWKLPFIGCW